MSLVDRLEQLFEDARAKAYEFETPIADAFKAVAHHVEQIAPGAGDVGKQLEELVGGKVGDVQKTLQSALEDGVSRLATELTARTDQLAKQVEGIVGEKVTVALGDIDKRVQDLFGQLLKRAQAAEQGAPASPTAPAAPSGPDAPAAAQA